MRKRRLELGLTLQQAAMYAGISNWRNLQRWQTGLRELSIDGAQRLGVTYGCDWWQFFPDRTEQMENKPVNAAKAILRKNGIPID